MSARERLLGELREHALVIGEVTLSSGARADYYVDAKRAILRPAGFRALGELVAAEVTARGARAVGGLTMGADPVACAALAAGADVSAFFVRKERKQHGLQRWVEGPILEAGERCLIVEDVVTSGGSTVKAIERVLSRAAMNAREIEAYNPNYVGGDIIGGRMDLRQLFTRPVARPVPYTTPDPRLFICSSSTPPGGGVHGMCGYFAAKAALRRG